MFTRELLLSVSKPGRYIDGEINAIKKDLTKVAVKICLCFPDIYEIGMSHLGLRILYDLINRRPDCAAERVFNPWVDMEERLRTNHIALSSLESGTAVGDFDILGFSLQYELSYTNVLNVLSLAHIPLKTAQRNEQHPLVIAGGICCLNPEPMAEFIDAFVIGEAEEVIIEIIEIYKRYKEKAKKDKKFLLEQLCLLEGVYVPSLYKVDEDSKKRLSLYSKAPMRILKRFVKDLDQILDLEQWTVPYIEIVHDRIGIEIMRGCPHSCRFCQARNCFYPLRILSEDKILEVARRLYRKTGYEEISLLSLSTSDHPRLNQIVRQLMAEFKDKGVSISLPSLRAKNLVGELSKMFSTMRKTTLTFAPEAGSQRLRSLINKDIDMDELFYVAEQAYQSGYRLLKLYFMIGLPTETDLDLEEISILCQKLSQLKKRVDGKSAHLNVSISNFVPKPHTPFQWQGMDSTDRIIQKQEYLKKLFRKFTGTVHIKFHDPRMSFLEAVLSRGDRRLSRVISEVFQAGAKFDAWNNLFNLSLWLKAFDQNIIDPQDYLQAKSYGDTLNWDFIDVGIPVEVLKQEARSATT